MMRFVALVPAALLFAQADAPKLRLPDSVTPLSYEAELRLKPGVDDFSGTMKISMEVRRATPTIWLHAKELTFTRVSIGGFPATTQAGPNDLVAIVPDKPIQAGKTHIDIDYTGRVSRTLTDGVFSQQYKDDWYIFSKFEPVTARRAFPCFDEPSFKTPWQLTLRVPKDLKAFSNTRVEKESEESDGTRSIRFARTKPLPSYLVALAVGPFEAVDTTPLGKNKVPGRIIVPRGRAAEAAFAAASTPRLLQLLEEYLGTPYPYDKLDQIVVPITTSWGAMENAGLIAYGDQFILAKPSDDTVAAQKRRSMTNAHEMGHQWLGNLVTMKWWDDLWLNEGFATWIGAKVVDQWHPEWNVDVNAVLSAEQAKNADVLLSSSKVRQTIETSGDIALAFNGITYEKGAALLRMLENNVGHEPFRKGINMYLSQYAFGNATSNDLVHSLSKAAGKDLSNVAASVLDQVGIPLISVNVQCSPGSAPVVQISQQRFTPIGSRADATGLWRVPVCIRWNDGRECVELSQVRQEFVLKSARSCPQWIYANENGAGYYRTVHEEPWLSRLAAASSQLSASETVAMLQDVRALLNAGRMAPDKALVSVRPFADSSDADIVASTVGIVASTQILVAQDATDKYAQLIRSWFSPRARKLGWKVKADDSADTRRIRAILVPMVATNGRDEVLRKEAEDLAEQWLMDRKSIDRDMMSGVLNTAASRGNRALFSRLVDAFRTSSDQVARFAIVGALASFTDHQIVAASLDLILNGGAKIDAREMSQILFFPRERETAPMVWNYVKKNFDELNTKLPGARGIPYGATLPIVANRFCDEASATDVQAFFASRISGLSGGQRNLDMALESIRLCSARKAALQPAMRDFLLKQTN